MTDQAVTVRRPLAVTLVVAFVYVVGFYDAALGILVLLSRYEMQRTEDVVIVSLLGAGIILFGLLLVAVAAGVGHGSRLSRILVTVYVGIQAILYVVTIVTTDPWDWWSLGALVVHVAILAALWLPPGSRYFRDVRAAARPAAAVSGSATVAG